MRLNSEKCKEMIIDFSRNYSLTSGIQSVTIGEHVLERVEHAKMLGVTISNKDCIRNSPKISGQAQQLRGFAKLKKFKKKSQKTWI